MAIEEDRLWRNARLEVLGFEEHRSVLRDMDGPRVESLVPSLNTTAVMTLRLDGGRPFTVVVDETVVDQILVPWINSHCAAGCGSKATHRFAPDLGVCDSKDCQDKVSSALMGHGPTGDLEPTG